MCVPWACSVPRGETRSLALLGWTHSADFRHSSSMLAVLCLAQFFDPVSFGSLLASAHVLARSSK
jgi:hypothetical protein